MAADSTTHYEHESRDFTRGAPTIEREIMNTQLLETMFGRVGARVRVHTNINSRNRAGIDIRTDKLGEYFDIAIDPRDSVEYEVIDMRPDGRHLLLLARRDRSKQKFLCGHDERHWFVCAVPGASVSNVVNAMESLQPVEIRRAVQRRVKRIKNRLRRKNEAFIRQGEWFFVPAPSVVINPKLVLNNEPLSRGAGSKPHMCQFLVRGGGETVMVCVRYPQGISERRYRDVILSNPRAKSWDWRRMMRDPTVYVRGRIWHPDHKTVVLNDWHRVLMNTEREAPGARAVAFLD